MGMFDDLVPQKSNGISFDDLVPPSSGVTIAPKGGVAREATPAEAETQRISQAGFGGVASEAASNLVPSAIQFGKDVVQPFVHPVETAKAIGNVVGGAAQKLIPGEQGQEKYADAVGQFFADRYGGLDALKQTMAKDPVGFLADLSVVLSGGAGLGARAPGIAGQVAKAAGTASRAIDPINQALKVAKTAGRGVGEAAAFSTGLSTGVGGGSIKAAAKAGFEGGQAEAALAKNMRGSVPMEEVVTEAKSALSSVRNDRGNAYRAGMGDIAKDTTPLDFTPIDQAVQSVNQVKNFKGQNLSPKTTAIRKEISDAVGEWKALDPAEFHTAEGLDALKQKLGDIRDGTQFGTPERKVADQVYNAVKDQIVKQAPDYAKVMDQYREATTVIKEMEKALSLNEKASIDTALRKLQSVVRNNANTNYGRRVALVELLKQNGATNILEKLAGQALSSKEPRGLARALGAANLTAGGGSIAGALAGLVSPGLLIPMLGSLALQSPRLIGEVALAAGKAGKALSKIPARGIGQSAFQTRSLEQQRSR